MFKKKSIFARVLIPVVVVMMLQTLLISMVLFVNGTIKSLDDSAIESMRKNAENRRISLENAMVSNWSNVDRLEIDITSGINAYLDENNILLADILGNDVHEKNILCNTSQTLISTLRRSLSTGVFMYFIGDEDYESGRTCNGLYYRDLDPILTPADCSDILFLRGSIDVARKDSIQLDSLWNEYFKFSPDYPDKWDSYIKPLKAAKNYPGASSVNLSYWCEPHFISQDSSLDSNECITYTRPLLYDGVVVGIIGTEVQVNLFQKYIPASDFGNSGKSGYMLIEYDSQSAAGNITDCKVLTITGSYIKRIIPIGSNIKFKSTNRTGIYAIDSEDMESVSISIHPLRLYNTNTPFGENQWAIAVISADSLLFEASRNVSSGILYSSAFALLGGCISIYLIIRASTKPLISLADQIKNSNTDDIIIASDSDIGEIVLLCSTINAMREKRNNVESQLREERERYLIALESAADTFMEYDILLDSFRLYYFSGISEKPEISTDVMTDFMAKLYKNEVSHPDDIQSLAMFIKSEKEASAEIRFKASLFPHITGVPLDEGYLWFLLKAKRIYDDNERVIKVIGTAKEITDEKLAEFRRLETSRRDPTTGLYNREYGLQLVNSRIYSDTEAGTPFCICLINVDYFNKFEAYYGRVFGGVLLMQLSGELLSVLSENDVSVRFSNDIFLVFLENLDKNSVRERMKRLSEGINGLYTGENADLSLSVSIGAIMHPGYGDTGNLIRWAGLTAQYAIKGGGGKLIFYDELPADALNESFLLREKPINVFLDISRGNFVGFAFELFERTADVRSAINILLSVLGGLFGFQQIVICSYDPDFGADQVTYQWNLKMSVPYHCNIDKVSREEMHEFETLLSEDGALLFDDELVSSVCPGVRRMLCVLPREKVSAYCCVMYENGLQTGRIIFKAEHDREWANADMLGLFEVAKIIAAHISIEKSNMASRAKSEFLSRVSHDIRTPMNAIIGLTGIAKDSKDDPERISSCLDKIDFSAKHLLSLINDVLDMSRIESGKLNIMSAVFSMDSLVRGIDTLMRPPIESKGLSFVINVDITHDEVISDEYRLRQVLVNLLGNANKFTNPGGVIEFSIKEIKEHDVDQEMHNTGERIGYYKFSVKDTGIGVNKEDLLRIFIAFEQVKTSSEQQGTGLGLAICGNIISVMGGKIEVESNPGKGSDFYFTLGLKLGNSHKDIVKPEAEDIDYTGYFNGKKALLVEDNDINVEIALYILEDAGFVIDTARNGEDAIKIFNASDQGYYDIILMDIQMPIMDGLTATRNIRRNQERADARTVPIIAMTANAFDEDMKKSIESGMNGHIAKPIDNNRLYELLRECLKT